MFKKLNRIIKMDRGTIHKKIKEKLSYRILLRKIAYKIDTLSLSLFNDNYIERQEVGPINLEVKLERLKTGGTFESPITVIANLGAIELAKNYNSILEVGCGTGFFAYKISENPSVKIVASEFDDGARNWAINNRSRENIYYCKKPLSEFHENEFDLVIALEVIEHIFDFDAFLKELRRVAPVAIISTPNKNRDYKSSIANTPEYNQHVREWTAGEFYWVLRTLYSKVELFSVKHLKKLEKNYLKRNVLKPEIKKVGILTHDHILIARCTK